MNNLRATFANNIDGIETHRETRRSWYRNLCVVLAFTSLLLVVVLIGMVLSEDALAIHLDQIPREILPSGVRYSNGL